MNAGRDDAAAQGGEASAAAARGGAGPRRPNRRTFWDKSTNKGKVQQAYRVEWAPLERICPRVAGRDAASAPGGEDSAAIRDQRKIGPLFGVAPAFPLEQSHPM